MPVSLIYKIGMVGLILEIMSLKSMTSFPSQKLEAVVTESFETRVSESFTETQKMISQSMAFRSLNTWNERKLYCLRARVEPLHPCDLPCPSPGGEGHFALKVPYPQ